MAAVNISNQQMQPDLLDPITKFKLLIPRLKDALQASIREYHEKQRYFICIHLQNRFEMLYILAWGPLGM